MGSGGRAERGAQGGKGKGEGEEGKAEGEAGREGEGKGGNFPCTQSGAHFSTDKSFLHLEHLLRSQGFST